MLIFSKTMCSFLERLHSKLSSHRSCLESFSGFKRSDHRETNSLLHYRTCFLRTPCNNFKLHQGAFNKIPKLKCFIHSKSECSDNTHCSDSSNPDSSKRTHTSGTHCIKISGKTSYDRS